MRDLTDTVGVVVEDLISFQSCLQCKRDKHRDEPVSIVVSCNKCGIA